MRKRLSSWIGTQMREPMTNDTVRNAHLPDWDVAREHCFTTRRKRHAKQNPKAQRKHERFIASKSFVSAFTKITNEPRETENEPDFSDRSN